MASIQGILLAAGASRRFGANKLIRRLPDGEEVAVRACRNLIAAVDRVQVVLRVGTDELAGTLQGLGTEIRVFQEADRGIGASLAFAVKSSPPDIGGWLVALGDMPWIEPGTIASVAEAIRRGAALAAPRYRGRRGHPVGFSAIYREALSALDGDEGAKSLIRAHEHRLHLLDVEDPGTLRDVDRPADLDWHA